MKTVHFVSFSETEEVILNLGLVTLINVPVPDCFYLCQLSQDGFLSCLCLWPGQFNQTLF